MKVIALLEYIVSEVPLYCDDNMYKSHYVYMYLTVVERGQVA